MVRPPSYFPPLVLRFILHPRYSFHSKTVWYRSYTSRRFCFDTNEVWDWCNYGTMPLSLTRLSRITIHPKGLLTRTAASPFILPFIVCHLGTQPASGGSSWMTEFQRFLRNPPRADRKWPKGGWVGNFEKCVHPAQPGPGGVDCYW